MVTTDVVCRCVAVCRQRPRCVAGASLFWMLVGAGGVVDGGGGKEEAAWLCLSHACRIWADRCRRWAVLYPAWVIPCGIHGRGDGLHKFHGMGGWIPWNGGWIPWNGGWIPYFWWMDSMEWGMDSILFPDGFHTFSRWIPYFFRWIPYYFHMESRWNKFLES